MFLKAYINLKSRMASDEGEIGSWLLIAGLLAIGALAAGATLSGWFQTEATWITTNTNSN